MNTKPLLFSLATTFFSLPINAADIELIGAGSNLSDDAIATEYNFKAPIPASSLIPWVLIDTFTPKKSR